MYQVYVPFENINDYSYYYYSNDMSLIYCSNDNENFTILDVNNHYNMVDSNNVKINDLILINNENIVNNWFYRTDVVELSLLVVIFSIFLFYIPLKIFSRLFKRGLF